MLKFVNGLHFNNIRGDIYGGVTAAVVALPLALAFGVASGAGAIAGLYGAIIVGFFAAIFGGTPSQVSGPTGPMTVVMTAILTDYMARFPESGLALAFTVVIIGGLLQVAMGLLKLGRFISFVPFPVLSGFMSGIGFIIIILQLAPLVGHVTTKEGILLAFQSLPSILANPMIDASILGIVTLLIVYLWPARLNKIFPGTLLALFVGTGMYLLLFKGGDVKILGDIPTGIPGIHMPEFTAPLLLDMLESAVVLALLGAIDSLLTSLVADNKTRTHHDSDRELIGQGIGNVIAGFFWGLPGAGATMRTVVNIRAGGTTPISGALHSVILLAIVLGAGSLAANIPHAVLAGILVKVGMDIIDWDFLKRIKSAPRVDLLIMVGVLLMTVFVDLITAVGAGVIVSSLILVQRLSHLQLSNIISITAANERGTLSEEEVGLLAKVGDKVSMLRLSGPMAFAAARGIAQKVDALGRYEALVLDMTDVDFLDITTCQAVGDVIDHHMSTGLDIYLVGLNESVLDVMHRMRMLVDLDEAHILETPLEALQAVNEKYA
jgi:sulfate permease, SulP family